MNWLAETVRLTAFMPNANVDNTVTWWSNAVGSEPSERLIKSAPPALRESGLLPDSFANLVVDYQAGRVDFLLLPDVNPQEIPAGLPNIGQLQGAVEKIKEIALKWLPIAPTINRLAIGLIGLQQVENKIEGYKAIQPLLHNVKLDPEGSSDFSYAINRPRQSKTPGPALIINRLSKWSVVKIGFMQIPLGQTNLGGIGVSEGLSACRVELDINSAQDKAEVISTERLLLLVDEFLNLAGELMNLGDVP